MEQKLCPFRRDGRTMKFVAELLAKGSLKVARGRAYCVERNTEGCTKLLDGLPDA